MERHLLGVEKTYGSNDMNGITELHILDSQGNTVFYDGRYLIPLYQRAFAWTENEIEQLIDDINSFDADRYYLGSLIVNRNADGKFETIDGQQRLTALFLLLNYLDFNTESGKLSFECREKSNYTLDSLTELCDESKIEKRLFDDDKIEQDLIRGRDIIKRKFDSENIDKENFKERLSRVILFRIEVPPHTDLNRYFEIMNVRGEQLEQHDILKATLMNELDESERAVFAKIWDACRDMTGYVQMHFPKDYRESVFGDRWNWLDTNKVFTYKFDEGQVSGNSILEIISMPETESISDGEDNDGNRIRFDSIVKFPHFLIHALKVFTQTDWQTSFNFPEQLDDKKLLEIFQGVLNDTTDKKALAHKFILCLLKCRFLFDKYIIKREYKIDDKNDDKNGYWSLKELNISGIKSQKKPYYKDTEFKKKNQQNKTYRRNARNNLMLQSCLRVSYTSPKVMHWITRLLVWLYNNENLAHIEEYEKVIEHIAQEPIKKFLDEQNFSQGINTPHIVFNYLDYLLWKGKKIEANDFVFEFRNSVEHWYPQHPPKPFPLWNDMNRFGNLCIIQRDINSRFSNLLPISKKKMNATHIEKGSLKLRLMSEETIDDEQWTATDCARHEKDMLNILSKACKDNS